MPFINRDQIIFFFILALFIFVWWKQPILEKFSSIAGNTEFGYNNNTGASTYSRIYGTQPSNPLNDTDYDAGIKQEPSYLNDQAIEEPIAYSQTIIDKQGYEIRKLRNKLKILADQLDETGGNKYYRRKLSNKYYRPRPMLSDSFNEVLNLQDDDFSTKTLSTVKFLSQTRSSRYYGDEIHFPTELCGNFCTTSDPNAQLHEQLDLIRPITPTNFVTVTK